MRLLLGSQAFEFVETPLTFSGSRLTDLFARKNNKTVGETISHPKYVKLAPRVAEKYGDTLHVRLGHFLRDLKQRGDLFYREFLNPHGDGKYCAFRLTDSRVKGLKGLYCFTVDGKLKYIGKSTDSFAKRIDQGYGTIHPKNCYRDGQSTNCHLNELIAGAAGEVCLHLHPMAEDDTIEATEKALIFEYDPEWNFQLRRYGPANRAMELTARP
jgi:hypothetical protein